MALGFGRKTNAVETQNTQTDGVTTQHHHDPGLETGVYGYDVEKNDRNSRKMSRVAGPIPGVVGDSDADSAISVGKQVELEATNSIKYRTCSWQKVAKQIHSGFRIFPVSNYSALFTTSN